MTNTHAHMHTYTHTVDKVDNQQGSRIQHRNSTQYFVITYIRTELNIKNNLKNNEYVIT